MRSNFMLMFRNGQHHHQTLKVMYLNIQTHYMQSSLLARVFLERNLSLNEERARTNLEKNPCLIMKR